MLFVKITVTLKNVILVASTSISQLKLMHLNKKRIASSRFPLPQHAVRPISQKHSEKANYGHYLVIIDCEPDVKTLVTQTLMYGLHENQIKSNQMTD